MENAVPVVRGGQNELKQTLHKEANYGSKEESTGEEDSIEVQGEEESTGKEESRSEEEKVVPCFV